MRVETCPQSSELKDYLAGCLDPELSEAIDLHLSECDDCERAVEAIQDDPDTLVAALQSEETDAAEFSGLIAGPSAVASMLPSFSLLETLDVASYRLQDKLGSGGMGCVYRARHTRLDKEVAIKLLPQLAGQDQEFVARFSREMRAAGQLDHPAIVRSTDAGEHNGVHYLVMDLIDGMDLSRVARATGPLDIGAACEVVRQAALGLAHAHEVGIVHRDVKPSNLMLDAEGRVRILDFGLAQTEPWQHGAAEITTVGQLMGTLDYMAPEQAERGGAVDYRADLYALGATLFRLLTGRAPLAAAPDLTPLEKLRLLATHSAPKLTTLRRDAPKELQRVLAGLLSRDPALRPASASHVAELLEGFADDSGLPTLLRRAEHIEKENSEKEHAEGARPGSQLGVAPSAGSVGAPAAAREDSHGLANRGGRSIWSWVASGLAAALVVAGIVFIVDTSKGQLVIDSKDANVQVKLRKDGQVAKELTITPGQHSTKLWGGEYEIEIDSPSDRFTVSNQQFSILRGDIVVASIRTQPDNSASEKVPDSPQTPEPIEDERLTEIVYEGDTLDTWLRRLKYETKIEERERALNAIAGLLSPDLKPMIRPVIEDFIRSKPTSSLWAKAVGLLYRTHEGDVTKLTEFLEVEDHWVRERIASRIQQDDWQRNFSQAEREYVVRWALSTINESEDEPRYTINLLDAMSWDTGSWESTVATIRQITECEVVRPRVRGRLLKPIWLGDNRNQNDLLNASPEFVRASFDRAISVFKVGERTDTTALALQQLHSISDRRGELTSPQIEALNACFRNAIREMASGDSPMDDEFSVVLNDRRYQGWETICLNLVARYGLAENLQASLAELYAYLGDFPLGAHKSAHGISVSFARGEYNYEVRLYRQVGALLGKSEAMIDSRLNTARETDRQYLAQRALDSLRKTRDASDSCETYITTEHSTDAASVILSYIGLEGVKKSGAYSAFDKYAHIVARCAGDRFFALLAEFFTEHPSAVAYLNFSKLAEYECSEVKHLQPLLDWADTQLGLPESVENDAQRSRVAILLRSLLRDRTEFARQTNLVAKSHHRRTGVVSEECQAAIIDLLKQSSQLDDAFWVSEPAPTEKADGLLPFTPAFRTAMADKAFEILQNSDGSSVHRCEALICLASLNATEGELSEQQVEKATAFATSALERFVADFDTARITTTVKMPSFSQDMVASGKASGLSINLRQRVSERTRVDFVVCEGLLVLRLISDPKLAIDSAVKGLVEQLHELADSKLSTYNYISNSRSRMTLSTGLVTQLIHVRSGELLGKDYGELRRVPDLRKEELARKKFNTVGAGDTLAVYIETILPGDGQPLPVMQAGKRNPVTGYPVPVNSQGEIVLPLVGRITVAGKSIADVRETIELEYRGNNILKSPIVSADVLSKANSGEEIRALTTTPIVK